MLKLATSSVLLPEYKRKVLQFTAQRKLVKIIESTSNGFNQSVLWFARKTATHTNITKNVYIWVLFDQTRTTAGSQKIALLLISASYNQC